MGDGRTGKGLPPRRQRALNRSAGTTGFTPVSRKAAPAAKRAIAEKNIKNIAGGETGCNGVQAGRISAEQAYRQPERQKKSSTSRRILLAFYFICFYISVLTERWQSGRMRLTRNQLYSSRGTQGSNPCLSASLIKRPPANARYPITAFFCTLKSLCFTDLNKKTQAQRPVFLAKRGNPEIKAAFSRRDNEYGRNKKTAEFPVRTF